MTSRYRNGSSGRVGLRLRSPRLQGVDRLIAACARGDSELVGSIADTEPSRDPAA
jgi:hypothetical protein